MTEDLEAERDFLLKSIADLDAEHGAGDIDTDDYTALRDDYVARAADVLRQLEGRAPETTATPPRRRGRAALTIAASIAVAAAAGVALANAAGSRSEGGQLTGSLPTSTQGEIARAQSFVRDGKLVDALKVYDAIIKANPKQAQALAERGWLIRIAGLKKEGLEYIDRAIAADPTYPDAHFFRGMMLWEDNKDPAGAVAEFRLCLANDPGADIVAVVEEALRKASAEAGIPVE